MIGPPTCGHYSWTLAVRDAARHAATFGVRYTVKRVDWQGELIWLASPA